MREYNYDVGKIAEKETLRHHQIILKNRELKEQEQLKYCCLDCGIYCGPRRYYRNKQRCSKCSSKFKRALSKKLNSGGVFK